MEPPTRAVGSVLIASAHQPPYIVNVQRIFSIAFVLVYLGLAVGINVLLHTCGGETDANFAPVTQEDPCGCSDVMDAADRCCTVEVRSFQLQDDQPAPAVVTTPTLDASHILFSPFDVVPDAQRAPGAVCSAESPPPRGIPASILFCSFLI